jgi:hypothetical protein
MMNIENVDLKDNLYYMNDFLNIKSNFIPLATFTNFSWDHY